MVMCVTSPSADEIPEAVKGENGPIGVNVDADFEPCMLFLRIKESCYPTQRSAEGANELVLATDEDREGESISWHLLQLLKPKVPIKRMVFHEITQDAIRKALKTAVTSMSSWYAPRNTRILDRLVGYTLSPCCGRKLLGIISWAGAVGSGATLVNRERERRAFRG